MHHRLEVEQEVDGRWIADVRGMPSVLAHGNTAEEASSRAQTLALRVLADRLEQGEAAPGDVAVTLPII